MKKAEQVIQFHFLVKPFYFPHRTAVKQFLVKQLTKEGKKVDVINYIFCDDAYLLEMNQQYLNHDTLTDIITFELSPKTQPLLADIYISIDRVRENAASFRNTFGEELRRVIFHGVLHLAGYKDKTTSQAEQMRKKEEEYLTAFFVFLRNRVT